MGWFRKKSKTGRPPPLVEIHPDDRSLIKDEDTEWWDGLSFEDCVALREEDNLFRFAAWSQYKESDGLTNEDAAKKVRRAFPTFYVTLLDLSDDKLSLTGDDTMLPVVLKNRVNRAVVNRLITKETIRSASSVNALIRQLIRSGVI